VATVYAGGGGVSAAATYERMTRGILVKVSAYPDATAVNPTDTILEISLIRAKHDESNRRIHLVTGYLSNLSPLQWQGAIDVMDDDELRYYLVGDVDPAVRFVPITLTPNSDSPLLEALRYVAPTS